MTSRLNCGEPSMAYEGYEIKVSGWIKKIRKHGKLCFLDIGDRYGVTQVLVKDSDLIDHITQNFKREYVVEVIGKVIERKDKNPDMKTGEVELELSTINLLNRTTVNPFTIQDDTDGGDELRMAYRHLDLRRPQNQRNLMFRHNLALKVRNYLSQYDFLEIETPMLIAPTPEGAKDFLVPTDKGTYALPQSPQLMKQALMVAGMDRYFQITKCFRDEPLRKDRQLEFTQIDCEMSFVSQSEIMEFFGSMIEHLFWEMIGYDLKINEMSYNTAIKLYGSDKPDTRFDMKLSHFGFRSVDLPEWFPVYPHGEVITMTVDHLFSNKQTQKIIDEAKSGKIGLEQMIAVSKSADGVIKNPLEKFLKKKHADYMTQRLENGQTMFVGTGLEQLDNIRKKMGFFRLYLAEELGIMDEVNDKKDFHALWITDFPAFEYEDGKLSSVHHPFTMYSEDGFQTIGHHTPSQAYDLVINGQEIGGGSVRIHDWEFQKLTFLRLGMSEEEIEEKFGWFLKVLDSGAPPHAGIAFGLDRLCAVMNHQSSIRDFIAFPKNNQGKDLTLRVPMEQEEDTTPDEIIYSD